MRCLLLNYEFPPAGGGAGYATYNIGRELVQLGCEVDILTSRIEGEVDGASLSGMRIFRVPSWRKGLHDCGLFGAYAYVAFAIRKRRQLLKANAYDLEHIFFSLPTGALTLFPSPQPRLPYLVSLRGSDVPGYDPFNPKLVAMHRMLRPMTRRIWTRAAAVVALSQELKAMALKTAPQCEFDVIPNGIETDLFYPCSAPIQEDPGEPLKLIAVCRLLERKGLHHLLEAIAHPFPLHVSLDIVGTGSYSDELRRQCSALGLDDRVQFLGAVKREQLGPLYRAASLFVLPSQTESFGLVFAEAMACGLPVLATRVGGIPELVRDGTDGLLVEPAQPHQLRCALEQFISQPQARLAMGQAARQRVEEKYQWRQVAARYLQHYERISLNRQRGRQSVVKSI